MNHQQSLDIFIYRLANKIAALYPNSCADKEDYIQEGHLKLAEICKGDYEVCNFKAHAIVSISRAMREAALRTMCSISAPHRVKKQIYRIKVLLASGKTECYICEKLRITQETLISLKSLITTEPWHRLFREPSYESEQFSMLDDLLSSLFLTEEDRDFIQFQLGDTANGFRLSRNRRHKRNKNIRPKLIRSGYGTAT